VLQRSMHYRVTTEYCMCIRMSQATKSCNDEFWIVRNEYVCYRHIITNLIFNVSHDKAVCRKINRRPKLVLTAARKLACAVWKYIHRRWPQGNMFYTYMEKLFRNQRIILCLELIWLLLIKCIYKKIASTLLDGCKFNVSVSSSN
jgi:hypothetical protein